MLGQALSGSSGGIAADYRPGLRAQLAAAAGTDPDPESTLRGIARVFRSIAERAAPWWRIYRDAAAVAPEIAERWTLLIQGRRASVAALVGQPTGCGPG